MSTEVQSPTTVDGRLGRWFFLRGMGLVHLVAFLSFWVQLSGLIGSEGISPATEVISRLTTHLETDSSRSTWHFPTLFWVLGTSDWALHMMAALGTIAACLLILGRGPRLMLFMLWGIYLSFYTVTEPFLGFQWDILLLESTLLAILYAPSGWRTPLAEERPPHRLVLWSLRFLLFKLIISSGLVKLASGDSSWQDLSALDYHFWTQPLPHAAAWWAHHMPEWSRHAGVLFNHFVELAVPFLIIFNPRGRALAIWLVINLFALSKWGQSSLAWFGTELLDLDSGTDVFTLGHCAIAACSAALLGGRVWPGGRVAHPGRIMPALLIVALMASVGSSGNYGYFNLLTIVLCIPLIHDAGLRSLMPKSIWHHQGQPTSCGSNLRTLPIIAFAAVLFTLSALRLIPMLLPGDNVQETTPKAESTSTFERILDGAEDVQRTAALWARRYAAVNGYGLFARMTKTRFELQVEGSLDGKEWYPYTFRYKPNSPDEMPVFAAVHMPRLDWQLWFSALRPRCSERWFFQFLQRLTEGSDSVLGLMGPSPFEGTNPRYVRVKRFAVEFSDREADEWWVFRPTKAYCPEVSQSRLDEVLSTRRP